MKKYLVPLAWVVVCSVACTQQAQASGKKNISGSGCVEKAVENSCRVVIDSQTGELYNLTFPAKKPQPGTAIKFSGMRQKSGSSCTQGKPVKVSKWTKEKGIKCPPPAVMAESGR